ncbi:SMI1/KNR4 family protein [Capnocytophaga felis]|uniref:Knr4/Smi1-like domain-containing protein n=1 Tax=Capnocytophaga felis TaxID=2267611 RepID=A0A5M4B8B9_9FLAO|nr:SMI1/KNR4 family protein [Capnocytophaga felis]GET45545.1 hypothetical protein RCZ01_08470 [Capnocytophaga felis]GET47292.1 hypothetical protein RCZ02_01230 [Capnocytophaga felis]
MNQKKLKIPKNYFELISEHQDNTNSAQKDQYGFELDTELNIFYETKEEILEESQELPKHFPLEEAEDYADYEKVNEYDLGYLTDFSKILTFGMDGAGCQFCMDFNKNENEPRIIFWDDRDLRWRVIADNIEKFFALFKDEPYPYHLNQ